MSCSRYRTCVCVNLWMRSYYYLLVAAAAPVTPRRRSISDTPHDARTSSASRVSCMIIYMLMKRNG